MFKISQCHRATNELDNDLPRTLGERDELTAINV